MKPVHMRLDDSTVVRADALVCAGLYGSRSSLVRAAVASQITKDEEIIKPLFDVMRLINNFGEWYSDKHTGKSKSVDSLRVMLDTIDNTKASFSHRPELVAKIEDLERSNLALLIGRYDAGGAAVQDQSVTKDIATPLKALASAEILVSPILDKFIKDLGIEDT